ncbi:hypothetical protein [Zophobihabitans entericus]|uniref:Uncharacterized protein n=1 Tax=Zophobihabitans entericus TaxID=1635327 RepID=A0A6G9IAV4_9GAMM|nr:hypothetical protein [Zophobihabitans entericus]QIQ21365.1 hypothetical protein IPMB12_06485 [Zophobihabitans entericus]
MQNNKEIVVDTVNEIREAQELGYKKIIATKKLSTSLISIPSLTNEFYIFISGAEDKPLPILPACNDVEQHKIKSYMKILGIILAISMVLMAAAGFYDFDLLQNFIFILLILFGVGSGLVVILYFTLVYKKYISVKDKYFYKAKYNKQANIILFHKKKYSLFKIMLRAFVIGVATIIFS